MHFTGLPLPGLPFHCQHHTAPAWACSVSGNANHSFLDLEMPTIPSWIPGSRNANHSTCQAPTPVLTQLCMENLPWASAGRERGATECWKTPQGNRGHCSPCFQLCWGRVGQDWTHAARSIPSPLPASGTIPAASHSSTAPIKL